MRTGTIARPVRARGLGALAVFLAFTGCSTGIIGDAPGLRDAATARLDATASDAGDAGAPSDADLRDAAETGPADADATFADARADAAGDVDAGPDTPDTGRLDGTTDAETPCEAETNDELCDAASAVCGELVTRDRCGFERTIASCGSCTLPATCAGGGVPNQCGTTCTPLTDAELCAQHAQQCGPLTTVDNCGVTRNVASCGQCPTAAAPVLAPPPSPISNAVQVSMTTTTPNATIHYTLDGTPPVPGSPATRAYSGAVSVAPGVLVRALTRAPGHTDSPITDGYYEVATPQVPMGINVAWFNAWDESQPLANVAHTGRAPTGNLPLDANNEPRSDFSLIIYEGNTPGGPNGPGGGAQFGVHQGRFRGQATLTGGGGTVSNVVYDALSNMTTFNFTTTRAQTSQITFASTRRRANDAPGNGVRELAIMRPGHTFGDFLNTRFTEALRPFTIMRVGPGQSWTYETTPPVWSNRAKPDASFNTTDGNFRGHGAPWETLARMANELQVDLWISLPPNADDEYVRNIFRIFFYGSDGVNPYTSPQASPRWRPLDPDRKLYFEVGNEIWNGVPPYGAITDQFEDLATASLAAGDPHDFNYANSSATTMQRLRLWYAYATKRVSELARGVVGDAAMMTRFRPVLAAQSANPHVGIISLSWLMVVHGGHAWAPMAAQTGRPYRGEFLPNLLTPEDGVSINQFGNVAHPITHWIYGLATAPYIHGNNVAEMQMELDAFVKPAMSANIQIAIDAGIVPMTYEGGSEDYPTYDDPGFDLLIDDMLDYWFTQGGGPFVWFALAGNNGSGLIPDLTRQHPAQWPKMRGIYFATGLPIPP
ncbi:chitobiase/beta-hexosaminidase C-terminal domain-containing protein [Myxococcota bacterium]|nr:chitobiase/beta-hexosaminidase C-terminal domain-containing protein [Myxococcota bacterium]